MSDTEHSPDARRGGDSPSKRERARTAALVVLAILITLFAVLNTEKVKVHWIVGSSRAPVIIVIVISALVGAVLSYFADRRSGRKRS
jgi:uncharacterized integral membrane protein